MIGTIRGTQNSGSFIEETLSRPLKAYHNFFAKKIENSSGLKNAAWVIANVVTGVFAYPILGTIAGLALLYGRVSSAINPPIPNAVQTRESVTQASNPVIHASNSVIQTPDSKVVRSYTGDLTLEQKSNLSSKFIDENRLHIDFKKHDKIDVSIRLQDMFTSDARVIVNAANAELRGGGGIDGAIHKKGGESYRKAHQEELRSLYPANYVLGHAAMIRSGLLSSCGIENVIVVAGPQGKTDFEKEDQLYSCYYNSLMLAESQNKTSIAFPSISTGLFHFPKDRAASISLKAIYDFLEAVPNTGLRIISIHFLPSDAQENLSIYQTAACDSSKA